jgi:acylphosphatase
LEKLLIATVHGVVQGVGYRYFVQRQARAMSLTGYVENQADGTVKVVAQGEWRLLERLLEKLKQGPRLAEVTEIDYKWEEANLNHLGFEIRY